MNEFYALTRPSLCVGELNRMMIFGDANCVYDKITGSEKFIFNDRIAEFCLLFFQANGCKFFNLSDLTDVAIWQCITFGAVHKFCIPKIPIPCTLMLSFLKPYPRSASQSAHENAISLFISLKVRFSAHRFSSFHGVNNLFLWRNNWIFVVISPLGM